METNTKSAVTNKNNDTRKNCDTRVTCCPSAYNLTKLGWRQQQHSNCRRGQVDKIGWCGFRSLVSSLSARLTAGITNHRVIPTSSSDVQAQSCLQAPLSSKEINLAKELSRDALNVPNTTEVDGLDISVKSGCIGSSYGGDAGMRKMEDCSGWWWWDTAWNDLTSVTPADASTFWNELNSWLTTTPLDNDSSPKIDPSCSSSTAAQHVVTSAAGTRGEDELAKDSDCSKMSGVEWCHSALLRAASHGHRDAVCDILLQTSQARQVAAMDSGLYDFVNCSDSQVLAADSCL